MDGRIVVKCHAGCAVEAVVSALGLEMGDLFPEGGRSIPSGRRQGVRLVRVDGEPVGTSGGLTLEQLAEAKRLPPELLAELGCETVPYFGPSAVQIPYTDETGEIVGVRYRLALSRSPKFKWKKGTKAARLLYGASRLHHARDAGYVVLVEGESDAWTLMHHGYAVVALPGAGMWSDDHVARLDGIETVYAVVEPDRGGQTLVDALRRSALRPRVRVVRLPTKDVSELHLLDAAAFPATFDATLAKAATLLDVEDEERRQRAAAEWACCEALAREPDILAVFEVELRRRGFVGPTNTPKLVFLVLVSRRLPRPVSLVLRGLSSAGKSYSVESVLPFFPASAYFGRSGMSERALVYSDEDFRHRILYIVEADAVAGDGLGAYFLRTLVSENRLVYETVEKDGGRLVTRVIEKPGPTGVILTTTSLRLHPENETRMLALTVSDEPRLTRQIMRAIARRDDELVSGDPPAQWSALQRWLETGGEQRIIDDRGFLRSLAEMIPAVSVRLRRDFALVRSLIFANAILHQASRGRDEQGRIVATLADYAVVHELIADILAEGIGATTSDDIREIVAAVETAIATAAPATTTVTRAQVQTELGLDERATRRRLAAAVDAGFVINNNPGRGKTARYSLGDPIPENVDVLPEVTTLQQALGADNPDNPATDAEEDHHPLASSREQTDTWLARDGIWRSLTDQPPVFLTEVIDRRASTSRAQISADQAAGEAAEREPSP